uniref:DUF6815 domain-containing protein n=1 Tax=Leptocylindrus danicus TaxID=163516 RepID=A0A7S2KTG6_9STRA|mmetsp:Transcript_26761/g.39636  ORF Transcript_26761/g.39636 Transcript_26761/m.39636 type:complete len:504 (+) Transcript_26761:285-1796(+)
MPTINSSSPFPASVSALMSSANSSIENKAPDVVSLSTCTAATASVDSSISGTIASFPKSLIKENKTKKEKVMRGFIPILEAAGGTDKNEHGHRRDSAAIQNAIEEAGSKSVIVQFHEEQAVVSNANESDDTEEEVSRRNNQARAHNDALRSMLLGRDEATGEMHVSGLVLRNNPGTLSSYTQAKLDAMVIELDQLGVKVMSHPEVQKKMGAKDSLCKIRHLRCGLEDTDVYYDADSFRAGFRKSIAFRPRVIKQNRGSQGEGIWICKLKDEASYCDNFGDVIADLDTKLVLMEANDNHVEEHTVAEFLEFCINGRSEVSGEWHSSGDGKYLEGGIEKGAMLVDQRFLPRIVEGEVRCMMIGDKLVELIHKKPKAGGLSATLQSGAVYTKYPPDAPEFENLVANFKLDLPRIMEAFGISDQPLPLLWTADYIFGEKDEDGKDTFHVGEFNCSCVGITQQLHLAELVGETAFRFCFPEDDADVENDVITEEQANKRQKSVDDQDQ